MSNTGATNLPAAWFPDPGGSGQLRWWDGTAWTSHLAPAPVATPAPVVAPVVVEPTVAADNEPYVPFQGSWNAGTHTSIAAAERAALPTRRSGWSTGAVWFIAVIPLIYLLILVVADLTADGQIPLKILPAGVDTITLIVGAIVLAVLLFYGMAAVDGSTLRRRGYDNAPGVGWSLLGPLIYLIVRAIRLRWESRATAAPLIVYVGAALISGVASGPLISAIDDGASAHTTVSSVSFASSLQTGLNSTGGHYVVKCPDVIDETIGTTFDCTAIDTAGTSHDLTIAVVASADGSPTVKLVSVTPAIAK